MASLLVVGNPRRKRKHHKRKFHLFGVKNPKHRKRSASVNVFAAKNPRRKHRKHFRFSARHNPKRRMLPRAAGGVVQTHGMPALIGAAGGVINDVAVGYLSGLLPASLQSGALRIVTKAGTAVGLGMLGERFVAKSTARMATVGALTCVLHDALRGIVGNFLPSVQLGEHLSEYLEPYSRPQRLAELPPMIPGILPRTSTMGALVGPSSPAFMSAGGGMTDFGSHTQY